MSRVYHNIKEEEMLVKNEWIWLLGFLWADGTVRQKGYSMELKAEDFDQIWPILQTIGFVSFSERSRFEKYNQKSISASKGVKTLMKYNFNNKSNSPPTELWKVLTYKQKCLFLRGLFEGDGSYAKYNNKNNRYNHLRLRITLNGKKDYDWSFILNFFEEHGIKSPCIERKTRIQKEKERSYSILSWTKIESIKKIFDILYSEEPLISLNRKYTIAKFFLDNYSPIRRIRGKTKN